MNTLIIVDIQYDFLPGGALAVPHGDEIIPIVNRIQPRFDLVAATQDWHPPDHGSFAPNHPGKRIYDQMLKPAFLFDGRRLLEPKTKREIGFEFYAIGN